MCKYFYPDTDPHAELLNEKLAQPFLFLTQEQRKAAKKINYIGLYSGGIPKMSECAEGVL